MLIAGIVQAIVGARQRKLGGVVAENGRRAANWGLTQIAGFLLVLVAWLPLPITAVLAEDSSAQPPTPFIVLAVGAVVVYMVLCVVEAVYAIAGTVIAAKGNVAKLPSIPFLRAR